MLLLWTQLILNISLFVQKKLFYNFFNTLPCSYSLFLNNKKVYFLFFLKALSPTWGTGRCGSRPGREITIVENLVGTLCWLLRIQGLLSGLHYCTVICWKQVERLHNTSLFRSWVVVAWGREWLLGFFPEHMAHSGSWVLTQWLGIGPLHLR